jgi:CRP-like cAMP-binding protein
MNLAEIISKIPLFTGLPQEQMAAVARITVQRSYRKGQPIFSEDDSADGFYVPAKGRVKVFKLSAEGKEQILHIIQPGEPFGEVAMFIGTKFPAYAEALEESLTFFFPRQAFMDLLVKDPSLSMNMLAILSKRLKQFTLLVEDLSLKEVPQRLAAFLLYLAQKNKDAGDQVTLDVTKGQLASLLGTIPETLSRILYKMVNQEWIRVQGREITILDRAALEDLASARGRLL